MLSEHYSLAWVHVQCSSFMGLIEKKKKKKGKKEKKKKKGKFRDSNPRQSSYSVSEVYAYSSRPQRRAISM